MPTTLKAKINALGKHRRARIAARAAELIAEEMSLRDLRHAHNLTQERLGESLGITQDGISRIEQRTDLLISTLRSYVEAMGGDLHLVAQFPDRSPIVLKGLATIATETMPRRGRSQKATHKTPYHRHAG